MNPNAIIEHIPADWHTIEVGILHAYLSGCNLSEAHFKIYVSHQTETKEEISFAEIWSHPTPYAASEGEPTDEIFRQSLTQVTIPDHILEKGPYCLKVEVNAQGGNWKSNWAFEGAAVTKAC